MWIVAIAWMYVTVMMALAEASSPQGTLLGALFTFLLYGVGPLALVLYLMGAPARRKALRRAEQQAWAQRATSPSAGVQADGGGLPSAEPVAPVGEEAGRR